MDLKGLVITTHAREQFIERCAVAYPSGLKSPEGQLWKLLGKAKHDRRMPLSQILHRSRIHGE